MMWMHHADRVLRSPEGEGSGGGGAAPGQLVGAPQGAPAGQPQGQPQAAGEYVPRSMFEETRNTRDAAKHRAREAEAKVEQLERELADLRRPPQTKPPESNQHKPAPDGAADPVIARLEKIEQGERQRIQAERQRTLSESIAAQVPNPKLHSLIPTIIRGAHPDGLPDGEIDALATSLLTTLKSQHPSLFEAPPGSQRTAIQRGPDGQINWDEVTSMAEAQGVAQSHGIPIPTKVYGRLRTQNQGAQSLILGSRPTRPST